MHLPKFKTGLVCMSLCVDVDIYVFICCICKVYIYIYYTAKINESLYFWLHDRRWRPKPAVSSTENSQCIFIIYLIIS